MQREKIAIQKGYGKLVNDRNQMELALLKSKRIQAALLAGDDYIANEAYWIDRSLLDFLELSSDMNFSILWLANFVRDGLKRN